MKVMSDPTCPLCQEEEETALHLLGRYSTLTVSRLVCLHRLNYTDLGNIHISGLAKSTFYLLTYLLTYVGLYYWSLPSFREISRGCGLTVMHVVPTWLCVHWMSSTYVLDIHAVLYTYSCVLYFVAWTNV